MLAGPCAGTSVCIERITANSSACFAISGSNSLNSVPLWPCFVNFHGEPMSFARPPGVPGLILPWSAVSFGFGSSRSTCEGAPFMQRKITRLAVAGKCEAFGASGFPATLAAKAERCARSANAR